jgi:hypothetical protein
MNKIWEYKIVKIGKNMEEKRGSKGIKYTTENLKKECRNM